MVAMLGTVFSNNMILLFVFWELTGIASFLLIGFSFKKEISRIGARMALLVTGSTGLIMFVGLIFLSLFTGTYDLNTLLSMQKDNFSNVVFVIPFVLIILGAFGKSAQFPFHFWLPNAMAAPTPVSAYLHSAAMVKLGIFLTARFFPIFSGLEQWPVLLMSVGFLTMLVGAVYSLFTADLKGVLAFTTVSQLGYLIGYYGLGAINGVEHDFFHILNHVFYKASLFMIAGIVIHSVGTKDIRKISGLFSAMPLTAIATIFAAASMAGIPGTTGFLSKELLIEQILHTTLPFGISSMVLIGIVMVSAASLFATGLRLVKNVFFGEKVEVEHKPSLFFQLPAFILASCTVLFGLFPSVLESFLNKLHVPGLHVANPYHIKIWHGFNTALLISTLIVVSGIILYQIINATKWKVDKLPLMLQFDTGFNAFISSTETIARSVNHFFRFHKVQDYLFMTLLFMSMIFLYFIYPYMSLELFGLLFQQNISMLNALTIFIMIIATFSVLFARKWISKLVALSVLGFLIAFYFVIYKAPDLALTQLMIESVSLVLVLIFVGKLSVTAEKKELEQNSFSIRKFISILIASAMGLSVFTIIMNIMNKPDLNPMGNYFLQKTVPLAGGTNTVNTILVDFRGFDTMGEISVLVIAALGVIGLLTNISKGNSNEA